MLDVIYYTVREEAPSTPPSLILGGTSALLGFTAVLVPILGRHRLSPAEALTKGVSIIFSINSHVDLWNFKVPINSDCNGALHYIHMKIVQKPGNANNRSALTATIVSGELMGIGTVLVAEALRGKTEDSIALCTTVEQMYGISDSDIPRNRSYPVGGIFPNQV